MRYKVFAYRVRFSCPDAIYPCSTRDDAIAKCTGLKARRFIPRFEVVDRDGRAANFRHRSVEVAF